MACLLCLPGAIEVGYSPAVVEKESENRIVVAVMECSAGEWLECSAGFL